MRFSCIVTPANVISIQDVVLADADDAASSRLE